MAEAPPALVEYRPAPAVASVDGRPQVYNPLGALVDHAAVIPADYVA
jgi:hypothetical protein